MSRKHELRTDISERKEDIHEISMQLSDLRIELQARQDELAPLVCPVKVGDTLQEKYANGTKYRVTKIIGPAKSRRSAEYAVFGSRIRKNGTLYARSKELFFFGESILDYFTNK